MTSLSSAVERRHHPLRQQAGAAASAQAVKIKYTVPDHVIIREETPRVAFFDADLGGWNEDCMAEIHYNADTRVVGFHTVQLTSAAIVQVSVCVGWLVAGCKHIVSCTDTSLAPLVVTASSC